MKSGIIAFLFFLASASVIELQAQNINDITYSTAPAAHNINTTLKNPAVVSNFSLDSCLISNKNYTRKSISIVRFTTSASVLTIENYVISDITSFTTIIEESPKFPDLPDSRKLTEIYFLHEEVLNVISRTYFPVRFHGVSMPEDSDKAFGYNKAFTPEYLITLNQEILSKINQN